MSNQPSDRSDGRIFEVTVEIAAARDAVFAALTSAEELSRWFAPTNECSPEPGGAVLWEWSGHFSWPQEVMVLEPGRRLQTRYDSAVDDGAGGKRPLFIDFVLEGDGGTTTLRLVHSGFGDESTFDEEYDGIRSGWPIELRSLQLYLERHRGRDRQLVWSRAEVADDRRVVWERLFGPGGLQGPADLAELAPGDRFELRRPSGDPLVGRVIHSGPTEFAAAVTSHGEAFLRLWAGASGAGAHVWLWLAMYGQDPARVAAEQRRFDELLRTACPARLGAGS